MKPIILIILFISVLSENNEPKCESNSDCLHNHICKNNVCIHKGFIPPNFSQIIEIALMCSLSAVATVAGVGGGAIYSALLMFVENFEARIAFPLSSFSIFICSIVSFTLGVQKKLKNPSWKFVDYDLVLVFCPALLLGTKFGVIFNTMFPTVLLILLLIASLSFSCFKTYKNALKAQLKEKTMLESNNQKQSQELEEINRIEFTKTSTTYENNSIQQIDIFNGENAPIKLERVKWVFFLLFGMLLDQLLEGSNKLKSVIAIRKCGFSFWSIFLIFVLFCLAFTKIFYNRIKSEKAENLLEETNSNEFKITSPQVEQKITKIILFCFLAGTVAGMLGIGGGMFMAPLMLELGIDAKVATSTSNVFLMFTSFSSTFLYLLSGNLILSYAILFGIVCGFATYFGNNTLTDYVDRTKKNSALIWALFFVSLISLIILPINGIKNTIYKIKIGVSVLKFNSFCN